MEKICSEEFCTGCWACYNACPKQCIEMKEGDLLHLYPQINQEECMDCGACKKVCPVENPIQKSQPLKTYAARAKDENEYRSSTSGGMGAILSRYILEAGGVVYGCASLQNINVQHIRITDEKDIINLKGSKYVQSSINDSYRMVKQDLQKGKLVLFTGTPCQIAGLRNFLKVEYKNLYLVDLICHGVPSLGYLSQHIHQVTNGAKVESIHFREGNDYTLAVSDKQKVIYRSNLWNERYKDAYYNAFIDGYSSRLSCHECIYASPGRVSDITIGDYWGLKGELPIEHDYGTSCVLVNSEKGLAIIDKVSNNIHIFERELDEAVKGNDQLRCPQGYNWRIKLFLRLQKYLGISKAYRICEIDHSTPKINGLSRIIERAIKKVSK